MEEYDRKLSINNPVLTAKTISGLVEIIQEKLQDKTYNKKEIPELKYLKEKFICNDPNICVVVGKAFLHLIQDGTLEISNIMSEISSMIPFAKNCRGIIMVLSELSLMDLESKAKNDVYVCPFSLTSPQHPLITILIQNPETWMDILNYLKNLYKTDDGNLLRNLNELFRPLFIYVLCDPFLKVPEYGRMKFLEFVLDEAQCNLDVVTNIIGWLQIYSSTNHLSTSNTLITISKAHAIKSDREIQEFLQLSLVSLLHEIYLNKWDPTQVIFMISVTVKDFTFTNINPFLIFLAKSIIIVPVMYLKDLLNICKIILRKGTASRIVKNCLKASLLTWMLYRSVLSKDCMNVVNDLCTELDSLEEEGGNCDLDSLKCNKFLQLYQNTNQQIHFIVEVCDLLMKEDLTLGTNISRILKYAENSSVLFLKYLYVFLTGIFLGHFDEDVIIKSLSLLIKYVNVNNEIASNVLTLILYKLANTKNSKIHFELLRILPRMAILKENVTIVLSTIHVISKSSPEMKTFAMTLFYELWNCDTKYYAYLQKLLLDDNPKDRGNFTINKAFILKEICKKKPELYGSELAAHLSKILNSCKTDEGVASTLALKGLKHLCTSGVIDIVTAWETLAPSFESENRENVIQSFCKLLAEVPELEIETPKYETMVSDIVKTLWYYTTNNSSLEVVKIAYETLSRFSHDQVSRHFPDLYRDDLAEKDDASDIVVLASGEWWLNILKNSNYAHFEYVIAFISKWVSKEIEEYGKGVYFMSENRAEPRDYYYLQIYSIVKALLKHVKIKYNSKTEIELACLNILSQEYTKALPPCDWSFLHELVHTPEYRRFCILVASHQVILSNTARRFMENFLLAVTEKPTIEDISYTVSTLKFLCNSIQPMLIRPFIEVAVNFALEQIKTENDTALYDEIISTFKQILKDKNIHDANKSVLARVTVDTIQNMAISSENFQKLLGCVVLLPLKYVNEVITPKNWFEISEHNFKRAVLIRCAMAENWEDSPMVWLNEIIDIAGDLNKEDQLFILKHISDVFENFKEHISIPNWILELLGQTQIYLIDANQFTKQVALMSDVLVTSMVTLSGHKVFLSSDNGIDMKKMLFLFPQALALQMKHENWNGNVPQILEWLHYMVNFGQTPADYKRCFYQSLIALRHEPMFKESFKWLKYLGCKIKLEHD